MWRRRRRGSGRWPCGSGEEETAASCLEWTVRSGRGRITPAQFVPLGRLCLCPPKPRIGMVLGTDLYKALLCRLKAVPNPLLVRLAPVPSFAQPVP